MRLLLLPLECLLITLGGVEGGTTIALIYKSSFKFTSQHWHLHVSSFNNL